MPATEPLRIGQPGWAHKSARSCTKDFKWQKMFSQSMSSNPGLATEPLRIGQPGWAPGGQVVTHSLPTTKVGQVPTTTPLETGLRVLLANRMGSKFLSSQDTRGSVVSHCQASLAPARNLFGKQEKYTIPHVYSKALFCMCV